MGIDHFDVIAVVLGVLFTVRKLDAKSREAAEFPQASPERFAAWQQKALFAYSLASYACFARVVLHFVMVNMAGRSFMTPKIYTRTGILIDLSWLGCVAVGLVMARAARKMRRELGPELESRARFKVGSNQDEEGRLHQSRTTDRSHE